jgi:hypothetical protein
MELIPVMATAAMKMPGITEPQGLQDFSQPITIRWDSMGTPDVTGWWLCVGTLEPDVEVGDWNILSGDMQANKHLTIDVSDRPKAKGLMVQLLCTVREDKEVDPDKRLDPPERTMVLDPIVIPSNKFASVFEALAIIAADQEKQQQQQQTEGHHPI